MVVRFREVSFKPSLFDHLDNDQNLQHTGVILEPSIGLGGSSEEQHLSNFSNIGGSRTTESFYKRSVYKQKND